MKSLRFNLIAVIVTILSIASCSDNSNEIQTINPESQLLAAFEKSQLDDNVMVVRGFNSDGSVDFELKDGWEAAWSDDFQKSFSLKPGDELCKGGGISFAKCVRDAVDDGKCVTVYKDSEGTYHGVESKCPEIIAPN